MSSGGSLVQETADSIDEVIQSQVPDGELGKFLVCCRKNLSHVDSLDRWTLDRRQLAEQVSVEK